MKFFVKHFLAIIVLAMLYAPDSLAECRLIDDWVADEALFGAGFTPKEGNKVYNEPVASLGLVYQSSLGTILAASYSFKSWTDINLIIKSFGSDSISWAEFQQERDRTAKWFSEGMYEWEGVDVYGYVYPGDHEKDLVETATMIAVYRGNTIEIRDLGLTDPEDRSDIAEFYNQLLTHAKSLIDQKCDGIPNNPPSIILSPSPDNGLEFQKSIAKDGGFDIVIGDPDGWSDIDFSSLKIYNSGVDITSHFLDTISRVRIQLDDSYENGLLVTISKINPSDFMENQNLFSILWNGIHKIKLEICDTKRECGSSTYDLYIGPFITAEKVQIDCVTKSIPELSYYALVLSEVIISNIGYESTLSDIFYVLQATEKTTELYSSGLGFNYASYSYQEGMPYGDGIWLQHELISLSTLIQHKTGAYDLFKNLTFPLMTIDVDNLDPNGKLYGLSKEQINKLNLLMGVLDREMGAFKIETREMKTINIEACDVQTTYNAF